MVPSEVVADCSTNAHSQLDRTLLVVLGRGQSLPVNNAEAVGRIEEVSLAALLLHHLEKVRQEKGKCKTTLSYDLSVQTNQTFSCRTLSHTLDVNLTNTWFSCHQSLLSTVSHEVLMRANVIGSAQWVYLGSSRGWCRGCGASQRVCADHLRCNLLEGLDLGLVGIVDQHLQGSSRLPHTQLCLKLALVSVGQSITPFQPPRFWSYA